MPEPMDRLETEALRLAPGDRARLARLLLESLDAAENQKQVAQAWETEVRRRVSEFRDGDVATIPAASVFSDARSRLTRG